MPKQKSSLSYKLNKAVVKNSELRTNGERLFCVICDKNIKVTEKQYTTRIDEHLSSGTHIRSREIKSRNSNNLTQTLLPNALKKSEEKSKSENVFNSRLTEAFIESNIPLHKLSDPTLKSFLEDFTKRSVPNESTLRRNNIKPFYESKIEQIRQIVGSNSVYFIVDESTDKCERQVLNI
jgi:hypothetical protein